MSSAVDLCKQSVHRSGPKKSTNYKIRQNFPAYERVQFCFEWNHKATHSVSIQGYHRPASETPFKYRSLVGRLWPASFTRYRLDWLQSLKQCFINVSYQSISNNRAIRVRLTTSIWYDTLMKNCFKDWSQSRYRLSEEYWYGRTHSPLPWKYVDG